MSSTAKGPRAAAAAAVAAAAMPARPTCAALTGVTTAAAGSMAAPPGCSSDPAAVVNVVDGWEGSGWPAGLRAKTRRVRSRMAARRRQGAEVIC